MAEKETTPGLVQRIAALPLWVRLAALTVLVILATLVSKWLVLVLLIALGLWPLTLLLGLGLLALIARRRGGWSWMKGWLASRLGGLLVPALAVLTALIIGALVLMFTDQAVYEAIADGQIGEALGLAFGNLARAYGALYEGALGSPFKILEALGRWMGGEGIRPLLSAVRGPSDSLVQSVPYIFAGLAVALGFRAGLFNIGAEGQIGMGWLVAVVVGFSFAGLPAVIHLPLAILLGAVAAGLWAAIAGFLKARTGAHEVITTIM
ncbi:MAG: ABC transporter permease subunit, partial [Anaerolineae bacterium]